MIDAAASGSEYESDLDVDLADTDTDEEINIDEAVSANSGFLVHIRECLPCQSRDFVKISVIIVKLYIF